MPLRPSKERPSGGSKADAGHEGAMSALLPTKGFAHDLFNSSGATPAPYVAAEPTVDLMCDQQLHLCWSRHVHQQRSPGLQPAVSLVSVCPQGRHDHPAGDAEFSVHTGSWVTSPGPSLIAAILKLSMHFPLGPPPQSSCLKGGHCHGPRQPAEALRLALSGPPADAG
jgi:hypothetical protein